MKGLKRQNDSPCHFHNMTFFLFFFSVGQIQRNSFNNFSVVLPFLNMYTAICILKLDFNFLLWIYWAAVLICASLLCFCRDFSQCSAHVSGRNCSKESAGLPRTRAQYLHLHRSVYRSDFGTPWDLGQGGSPLFYLITLDCLSLLWTSEIDIFLTFVVATCFEQICFCFTC